MKYRCPKCNYIFEGEVKFCPNCGQPLSFPKREEKAPMLVTESISDTNQSYNIKKFDKTSSSEIEDTFAGDSNQFIDHYTAQDHHKMMIYDIVLCLVILTLSLVAIFVDNFSEALGKLILSIGSETKINANNIGKIVALGWLVVTPHFLYTLAYYAFDLKISKLKPSSYKRNQLEDVKYYFTYVFFILGIVATIGLVVGFYFYGKPYLSQLTKSNNENFYLRIVSNFQLVYIWYITPIFNLILLGYLRFTESRLEDHPYVYMVLSTIVSIALLIGLPILLVLIGGVIGALIAVAIFIGGGLLFFKVLSVGAPTHVGKITSDGDIYID